jgi:hypothetical protein
MSDRLDPIRIPPATKHAAYSATAILPGESLADFERLHQGLIDEFGPHGALEHDIIVTVARLVWRKQNFVSLGDRVSIIEDQDLPPESLMTSSVLMHAFSIHDRLDAQIDRCLKRLLFVRGLKSLPGSASPPQKSLPPPTGQ